MAVLFAKDRGFCLHDGSPVVCVGMLDYQELYFNPSLSDKPALPPANLQHLVAFNQDLELSRHSETAVRLIDSRTDTLPTCLSRRRPRNGTSTEGLSPTCM